MRQLFFFFAILGLAATAFPISFAHATDTRKFDQSAKEIAAILQSPEVIEKIGAFGSITAVTRSGQYYDLTTDHCSLRVEVRYIGPPVPCGPTAMEIIVDKPICSPGSGGSIGNN